VACKRRAWHADLLVELCLLALAVDSLRTRETGSAASEAASRSLRLVSYSIYGLMAKGIKDEFGRGLSEQPDKPGGVRPVDCDDSFARRTYAGGFGINGRA
jgi:hypothetical protein